MIIDPEVIKSLLLTNKDQRSSSCPPLPGITSGPNQPAAVLIPLFRDQKTWKVLFIKRTHQESDRHSGQIAFPGGRVDPGDGSLAETALRETSEEIGLDPNMIEILGQSCTRTTVTGYEVTPFVGILPWPVPLVLSTDEVEKTLVIPLDWLVDPANRRTERWQSRSLSGKEIPVIFFDEFGGEVLWGATAQILIDFLELIQLGG
jgi:8-oxo-dGTP pyrophosphatase MutT (NUDIX family)